MAATAQTSSSVPVPHQAIARVPAPGPRATETAPSGPTDTWPDAVIARGNPWQPAITGWIVLGLLFGLAAFGLTRLKRVPGFLQNLWEFTYEWVEDITAQVLGPDAPAFTPYFFSLFVFILACNLLGLFPYLASPTAHADTTWALALCTFCVTHFLGLRRKGLGYIGHFFHIVDASKEKDFLAKSITFVLQWFMLPLIEFIGELARPVSLSMRLFGNIFAKEVLLLVLAAMLLNFFEAGGLGGWTLMVIPLALRPGILVLGVLVSVIQAAVFMGLSMMYVGGALAANAEHGASH